MSWLKVDLVGVPRKLWDSWPADRPLVHLASDALGIERRIQKGVDQIKERMRYKQLCDWIESLALEAVRDKKATVLTLSPTGMGHAYLGLIEALLGNAASSVAFAENGTSERTGKLIRESTGKSIFPPGAGVTEQRLFFEQLGSRMPQLFDSTPEDVRAGWTAVAEAKTAFYRTVETAGGAVVEVVSTALSCSNG